MTGELRRVLVRAPRAEDLRGWEMCGWHAEPDPGVIAAEHEAFCSLLDGAGAEVVYAESVAEGNPDAIYTYDPALVGDEGALLLHPGKECRRPEVDAMAEDFERAGVPIAGRLVDPEWAEGGDCCWLDERTLLVGCGYRTNEAGITRLRELLPDVEVVAYDLPHWHGRGEVMHLMSLISPLAPDLAVVYSPLLPTRLAQLLEEREVELVEVPDKEFASMGSNVLALAPADGTRRRRGPDLPRR
jgi:N-dimethylarginine dimethylaminohydrolase